MPRKVLNRLSQTDFHKAAKYIDSIRLRIEQGEFSSPGNLAEYVTKESGFNVDTAQLARLCKAEEITPAYRVRRVPRGRIAALSHAVLLLQKALEAMADEPDSLFPGARDFLRDPVFQYIADEMSRLDGDK